MNSGSIASIAAAERQPLALHEEARVARYSAVSLAHSLFKERLKHVSSRVCAVGKSGVRALSGIRRAFSHCTATDEGGALGYDSMAYEQVK